MTTDYPARPAIRLTVTLESRDEPTRVHPVGTQGAVVEALGPNAWIVELRIPDDSLVGDAWYEVFELRGDEFELVAPMDAATGSVHDDRAVARRSGTR